MLREARAAEQRHGALTPAHVEMDRLSDAARAAQGAQVRGPRVLPLLCHVDADSAALVQAVHHAGLRPRFCVSAMQAASLAQSEGAPMVVVQASAVEMSPRRLLHTLRMFGPLRVVLAGLEPGSLAQALALDLGFDEVWPNSHRGALLEVTVARAWGSASATAASPSAPPSSAPSTQPQVESGALTATVPGQAPLRVVLSYNSCTVHGRSVVLQRQCLRLLQRLVQAYPAAVSRDALASALGFTVGPSLQTRQRLDAATYRLRSALKDAGMAQQLKLCPVRGVGYRLEVRAPGRPSPAG